MLADTKLACGRAIMGALTSYETDVWPVFTAVLLRCTGMKTRAESVSKLGTS